MKITIEYDDRIVSIQDPVVTLDDVITLAMVAIDAVGFGLPVSPYSIAEAIDDGLWLKEERERKANDSDSDSSELPSSD